MKKYLCFLIMSFTIINAYSQINNGLQAPDILPKSPEVKGLEKYGEYPVSEYTGIPSINIPLYNVKAKDIEVPISLNYHATGIQVTQEATWAGLGWNLMAGGSISQLAVGKVDKVSYATASDWTKMINYSKTVTGSPEYLARRFSESGVASPCFIKDKNENSPTTDNMLMDATYGSGERDIYIVNFLGKSFRFSKHPYNGTFVYNGEKNKYKIEMLGSGNSWRITDEQGYIYEFSAREEANQGDINSTFTWYLTDIYYQWRPLIKIYYNHSGSVTQIPIITDMVKQEKEIPESTPTAMDNNYELSRNISYPGTNKQLYPSSIVGLLDSVVFTIKSRIDLDNGLALDEIKVFDRSSKVVRKQYKFEHDYFTGATVGESGLDTYRNLKRLKLVKLYRKDINTSLQAYQFTYDESRPLPNKASFSQDYWGFYNGQENRLVGGEFQEINIVGKVYQKTHTLISDPIVLSLNETLPSSMFNIRLSASPFVTFANRRSSKMHITTGMLKSIVYPTGGKTEFVFEPHVIDNGYYPDANVSGAGVQISKSISNFGTSSTMKYVGLSIDQECRVHVKGAIYAPNVTSTMQLEQFYIAVYSNGQLIKKYFDFLTDQDKIDFNNGKRTFPFEYYFFLPAGAIEMRSYIPSGLSQANGISATITHLYTDVDKLKKAESIGGGVRVKSITNYDENNVVTSVENYKYITSDGKPSGKLINPMSFYYKSNYITFRSRPGLMAEKKLINSYELSSSNLYNYSASGCDNAVVGYSRVEIETTSQEGNSRNGRKIVEFINNKNIGSGPKFFMLSSPKTAPLNGKQTTTILLDNNNDTISVERNSYSVENFESSLMNVWVEDKYRGSNFDCSGPFAGWDQTVLPGERFNIIVYPTNSYTVQLQNQSRSDYFGNNKIYTTTGYEYDPSNYQPKKITETLGDKTKIKEYQYAASIIDPLTKSKLVDKNMISVPVNESDYLNSILTRSKETSYWTWNSNLLVAPTSVKLNHGNSALFEKLTFSKYDSYLNPLEFSLNDGTKVTYLWGYNYQYPIAEIKNATYDQIAAIIPLATLEGIAKKMTPSDADFKLITDLQSNTTLKDVHVTAFKYRPLVGLIQRIEPNGTITYYDYDQLNNLKEVYIMENGAKKIIQASDYFYKNK